jgi:hypothetical protein
MRVWRRNMFVITLSMLKRLAVLACGLSILSTSAPAQAASEPDLSGSWSITFYIEPGHTQAATQCVVFTTTRTEHSGEERSGTWASPSFPGWRGTWQQDGDHFQWYGFAAAALASSEFGHLPSSRIISGEFNHFLSPTGATSSAGGWVGTRVTECGAQSSAAIRSSDPAVK